ncbi:MAG TPA: metallophosphoesterase [Stellaceae bacterium]|nr:metallophosphoesterase [Stellaceae bacterium]
MAHEITLTSPRRTFAAPSAELRIVHSSDLHVGEGFTEPVHQGDGTAGLRVVLQAARDAKADVVLLAGDTFEHNRLSAGLLDRAKALLAAAGMTVVILPGNHDPAIADSVFHRGVAAPANVHVLGVTDDAAVAFPDLGLEIWGHAHRDYGDMAPLARPRPRCSFWQIAMAHGHYAPAPDRSTKLRPGWLFGDDEIAATAADYVALGHWNRPVRVGSGATLAYYSGSPDYAGTVNLVRLLPSGGVDVSRVPVDWSHPILNR